MLDTTKLKQAQLWVTQHSLHIFLNCNQTIHYILIIHYKLHLMSYKTEFLWL